MDWITTDDMLGKEVIDTAGAFLGVVDKVFIDPKKVSIMGISIDKGFLKKGFHLGKEYIREITPHAVFLNIRPSLTLKGLWVFDVQGRKLGKVIEVSTEG